MAHNKILSALFLICCLFTSSRGDVGDIGVNSGERAILVCSRVAGAKCAWLRDGYSLDMGGRYTREVSCQLVIDPVLPLDQGHYQCRAGDWTQEVGSLKVNTAPSRPRIEAGARLMVDPGDLVELQCGSGGGRPAGEIQWWDEDTGERTSDLIILGLPWKTSEDDIREYFEVRGDTVILIIVIMDIIIIGLDKMVFTVIITLNRGGGQNRKSKCTALN